jgi:probable phosphoglycerate mutase
MKLIAIRHGEIDLNSEGKTTGWLDVDLSLTGRRQATQLAASLKEEFDILVSSPLLRALNTAEIIADSHPCTILLDPNLRERNFGSLNGKTWSEIEKETGRDLRHPDNDLMSYDYRPYGGECVEDVIARARQFIAAVSKQEGGGNIAAVTHGGIIRILYSLLPADSRKPITNCSVHVFYVNR